MNLHICILTPALRTSPGRNSAALRGNLMAPTKITKGAIPNRHERERTGMNWSSLSTQTFVYLCARACRQMPTNDFPAARPYPSPMTPS